MCCINVYFLLCFLALSPSLYVYSLFLILLASFSLPTLHSSTFSSCLQLFASFLQFSFVSFLLPSFLFDFFLPSFFLYFTLFIPSFLSIFHPYLLHWFFYQSFFLFLAFFLIYLIPSIFPTFLSRFLYYDFIFLESFLSVFSFSILPIIHPFLHLSFFFSFLTCLPFLISFLHFHFPAMLLYFFLSSNL